MEKYVSDVFDSMETDEHVFLHTQLIKIEHFLCCPLSWWRIKEGFPEQDIILAAIFSVKPNTVD